MPRRIEKGDRYGVERKRGVDCARRGRRDVRRLNGQISLRVAFHRCLEPRRKRRGIDRAAQKSSMNVGVAPTRQVSAT